MSDFRSEFLSKALGKDIKRAAKQHGEDDNPDHEVGDLQDCLDEALVLMNTDQIDFLRRTLTEKGLI